MSRSRASDASAAHCESYVLARHWCEDDEGLRLETAGGRYVDRFEKRGGLWKIAHRVVLLDWGTIERNVEAFPLDAYKQGLRSREDLRHRGARVPKGRRKLRINQ